MEKALVTLAIEYWQLAQLADSMLHEVPVESSRQKSPRLSFLLRQFERLLAEHDLRLIDYTRQRYEPNLPVLIMNKESVAGTSALIISRMHQPVVMKNGSVIEMGKVFVEPALPTP